MAITQHQTFSTAGPTVHSHFTRTCPQSITF